MYLKLLRLQWSLLENHEDRGSAEQHQQAYDYGNDYSSSGSACSGGDRRHLAKFTMEFLAAIASQLIILLLLTPSAVLATTYPRRWQRSLIGGVAMPLVVIPHQTLKRINAVRAETAMAARNRYAEMTALVVVTRVSQAGIVPQLMIDSEATGTRKILDDNVRNSPAEFILSNELARLLGDPIKIILENVQRHRMPKRYSAPQNDSPVVTSQVDRLDNIQLDVGPIKRVFHSVVDGKRRRAGDSFGHEQFASVAVHPRYFDLRLITRVSPQKFATLGIHGHRRRLLEIHPGYATSISAIRFGHHDPTVRSAGGCLVDLAPVQIARDPIHCQARRFRLDCKN